MGSTMAMKITSRPVQLSKQEQKTVEQHKAEANKAETVYMILPERTVATVEFNPVAKVATGKLKDFLEVAMKADKAAIQGAWPDAEEAVVLHSRDSEGMIEAAKKAVVKKATKAKTEKVEPKKEEPKKAVKLATAKAEQAKKVNAKKAPKAARKVS